MQLAPGPEGSNLGIQNIYLLGLDAEGINVDYAIRQRRMLPWEDRPEWPMQRIDYSDKEKEASQKRMELRDQGLLKKKPKKKKYRNKSVVKAMITRRQQENRLRNIENPSSTYKKEYVETQETQAGSGKEEGGMVEKEGGRL